MEKGERDQQKRERNREKGATQIFYHHRIPNQKFKLLGLVPLNPIV